MRLKKSIFLFLILILMSGFSLSATRCQGNTLELSLENATRMFLENNLQLIESRLDIEVSEAEIIRARLWPNPNLQLSQNIFNQTTKKYFDFSATGNTEIQLQQLFQTAGKKNKQIQIAQISSELSKISYSDLIRTLKFQLNTEFFRLYSAQRNLKFYDSSTDILKETVKSTEKSYEKRSILLSDLLRIKSLFTSLQSERLELISQIQDLQAELRVLTTRDTNPTQDYLPILDEMHFSSISLKIGLDELLERAIQNRADLKASKKSVEISTLNLKLEKVNAIPDLTFGLSYSRMGSYIPEYFAFNLSFDLPFFNRNQSAILVAALNVEKDKIKVEKVIQDIKNDTRSAYEKWKEANRVYQELDRNTAKGYDLLAEKMTENFRKRNINAMIFSDFYESYRSSMIQSQKVFLSILLALEELNYAVGGTVYD